MCGGTRILSPQIGAPLEKQDLDAMPPEKAAFIHSFFETAEVEMAMAKVREESQPFAPSEELRLMHGRLIGEFDSGHYCPVRQLEIIFDFSQPS